MECRLSVSGSARRADLVTVLVAYARLRHLLEWGSVIIVVALAAPIWRQATTTSLLDPGARAKVAAFVALGMALVAGMGIGTELDDLERQRKVPMRHLRLWHSAALAIPGLVLISASSGVSTASILLALIGCQMAFAAVLPQLQHWLPVLLTFGFMFVLGADSVRHEFSSWAIWIDPRPVGVAINVTIGVCGATAWVIRGPARSEESW